MQSSELTMLPIDLQQADAEMDGYHERATWWRHRGGYGNSGVDTDYSV